MKARNKRILAMEAALKELVKEKSFDKITIQDIATRANVTRATFYRHFLDKYDLMGAVYVDGVEAYLEEYGSKIASDHLCWEDIQYLFLKFILDDVAFFKAIVETTGQNSFFQFWFSYSEQRCEEVVKAALKVEQLPAPILMAIRMYLGGLIYTALRWVEEGCVMPLDAVNQSIFACAPEILKPYIKIKK